MLTMFNLFWDPTYVLIIIGMLLAMGASQYLNSTYRKYARIASSTELTGEEVAKRFFQPTEFMMFWLSVWLGN